MYKADLWRLCKLYKNSGVYADVDLVPYLNIDNLDKDITFYSCLSITGKSIFQAFMVNFSKPKNPLLFVFLLSFLINNPYTYAAGPTFDMYNCLKYMLNEDLIAEKKYVIDNVKIKIYIDSSTENIKKINLYYFPDEIQYTMKLIENPYNDKFRVIIKNNILIVKRLDKNTGWDYPHSIDIYFNSKASIFLFKENKGKDGDWPKSYVTLNNKKILDSRDLDYYNNNGW